MNINSIFNLYFVSLLEFVHKMFIHMFVVWITKILLTVDKSLIIIKHEVFFIYLVNLLMNLGFIISGDRYFMRIFPNEFSFGIFLCKKGGNYDVIRKMN